MLIGWKDIRDRVVELVGYEITIDSIRKTAVRDAELARIVGESVTGKPMVAEYELERWARMKSLPRASRARRIMRAIVEGGQMVLL